MKKVSEIVAEIAAASREQSGGIEQVNLALSQMDEMTQQNASLVEEAAAASETMGAQAQELAALVTFFNLAEDHFIETSHVRRIPEIEDTPQHIENSQVLPKVHPAGASVGLSHGPKGDSGENEWRDF